jgi:flagellar biosynthesis protein FlhB
MAQLQLRPHSVGDIIDASFTVYRKRFGPMIAVCLLLVFIPFVVSLIGGCTTANATTSCDTAIGWIGNIASEFGMVVASAATILAAAEAYAGIPSDWRQSAAAGLRRIIPIIVLTVVAAVLMTIGFVIVLIPGIFLAVSFAVATPALMIERVGPIESLKRSWRLATGERWRLFGAGLSMIIIAGIVFGILALIVYFALSGLAELGEGDASYYVQQVVTLLSIPLTAAVGAVLYVDLRVRKEDLDSAELGALLSRVD